MGMTKEIIREYARIDQKYPDQFLLVTNTFNHKVIVFRPVMSADGKSVSDIQSLPLDLTNGGRVMRYNKKRMEMLKMKMTSKVKNKRNIYYMEAADVMPGRKIMGWIDPGTGQFVAKSDINGTMARISRVHVVVKTLVGLPTGAERIELVGIDDSTGEEVRESVEQPPVGKLIEMWMSSSEDGDDSD